MFDLSLAEILLVVVVMVIFIEPKDLPVIVRAVARFIKTIRDFGHDIKQAFEDVAREAGIDDVKNTLETEIKLIEGDDGNMYESYQIPDIKKDKANHDPKP